MKGADYYMVDYFSQYNAWCVFVNEGFLITNVQPCISHENARDYARFLNAQGI